MADESPLASLPALRRIDPTGLSSLRHLQWHVEKSRPCAVPPPAPEPSPPSPVYPHELRWEEISELHKVLTEQERGVADEKRIERRARRVSAEDEVRPSLLCVNDDDRRASVYASQNSLKRALSFAAVEPSSSLRICLASGQMQKERDEATDVVVCLSSSERLFPSSQQEDDSPALKDDDGPIEAAFGVRFDVAKPLGMQLERDATRNSIVVHSVQAGYQAAREDLIREGLFVVTVNDAAVRTLDEFGDALQQLRAAKAQHVVVGFATTASARAAPDVTDAPQWRFETEHRLADRQTPKLAQSPVPRVAPLADAFDLRVGDDDVLFHVRVRNCNTFNALRILCTEEGRRRLAVQRDALLPGGLFRAALRPSQQLYLVVAGPDADADAPALVLQCGSGAVQELYGYSVVWQSTLRTLSCVAQSHLLDPPPKLDHLEPTTMAAKARVRVIEEFRAIRARGLAADPEPPAAKGQPGFQLTVI